MKLPQPTERLCLDCSTPVSRHNRFGRCRPCTAAVLARDPATRAKTAVSMKRRWKDPVYHARASKAISDAKLKRIAEDPAFAEEMRRKGSELGKSGLGHAAQDNDEFRARMAETISDFRLAWCPPEWRDRYREFRRRKVPVDEAKARTLDLIPPFELQLWKVRRGAGLVAVRSIARHGFDGSLYGNASAMCAEAAG